ncbi:MAG: Rpn family recombination-promoting nuclease/putative transposase [Gammaproteobacteria bacterium]|jgi:predicted transposase YdaD|nr:Rpn family recombination-promoting nuclease/putative transposase [Gammaproteobacteria bacterium]
MTDITNPHDSCFRQLMTQPENARSFFKRYLSPNLQDSIDLDTLALQSGSAVTQAFQQLHTDILYRVDFCDATDPSATQSGYLYTLVEHQSTPDPAMAVRLWQYKAALLLNHVQDDYLPPIHTLVFYHGRQTPYPYTLDLCQCFRTPEQATYTLQGPPQLIDVQQQSDQALLSADTAGLFSYFFKHVRDQDVYPALKSLPDSVIRTIAQDSAGFYTLKVLIQYYQIQANTDKPSAAFKVVADKLESKEQQEIIMTIGEALRQEGRQEGMQKGVHTVAANMLKEGLDVKFIQRVTNLSSKQIDQLVKQHAKPSGH